MLCLCSWLLVACGTGQLTEDQRMLEQIRKDVGFRLDSLQRIDECSWSFASDAVIPAAPDYELKPDGSLWVYRAILADAVHQPGVGAAEDQVVPVAGYPVPQFLRLFEEVGVNVVVGRTIYCYFHLGKVSTKSADCKTARSSFSIFKKTDLHMREDAGKAAG